MVIFNKLNIRVLPFCLLFISIVSCASWQPAETQKKELEPGALDQENIAGFQPAQPVQARSDEPETPAFVPVQESLSPLKTRTVSIAARNTPLRDVLYTVAKAANLNVVMETDVTPDLPVTMSFKDLTVENALNVIFDSVDYFYSIKDNILLIRATGTEIFEIGQPSIVQDYSISVGGDILSGTSSVTEEESSVTGDVSIKSSSDKVSFKFWDAVDKSLMTILNIEDEENRSDSGASYTLNRMAGTIMVTASKKELKTIRSYLDRLKLVFNRQVLIEARILEVQLSDGLKYGIDWTAVGKWLGVGTTTFGTTNFSAVIGATSPSFDASVTENEHFSMLLKALKEQGDVKTLSNPRVNIMNGQTSMLSVGRNTTFISRVETTTDSSDGSSTTTFTVDTNSVLSGIMFGLVPYINSNGEITLTITPIVTNLVDLSSETIGTGTNSVEIKLPTIDLREMSTTVKVLDGQIIIIGGLIDKKENLKESKVPILGDIPMLGKAFTRMDKSYENTELVVMLMPRIIK